MAWYLTAKSQSFVAGDPSSGAGAMTEWVKDLLCRHEGPCQILSWSSQVIVLLVQQETLS